MRVWALVSKEDENIVSELTWEAADEKITPTYCVFATRDIARRWKASNEKIMEMELVHIKKADIKE